MKPGHSGTSFSSSNLGRNLGYGFFIHFDRRFGHPCVKDESLRLAWLHVTKLDEHTNPCVLLVLLVFSMRGVDLRVVDPIFREQTRVTVCWNSTLVHRGIHELSFSASFLCIAVALHASRCDRRKLVAGGEGRRYVVFCCVRTTHIDGVVRVARAPVSLVLK